MKIRVFAKHNEEKQIVFQLLSEVDYSGEDLIVVNYGDSDPVNNFKKKLIADTLHMMSSDNASVDWKTIDTMVAKIMNTNVHMI
jgi:hypothetical protein